MERLEYMLGIGWLAILVMLHFWPVTLTLVVGLVVAFIKNPPLTRNGYRFNRLHLFIFAPLLVSLLLLLWDAIPWRTVLKRDLAIDAVMIPLLCLQLLASIGVIWLIKGYRWLTTFTVALEQCYGLSCCFCDYLRQWTLI